MKVILNYDEDTGQLTDTTGAIIIVWMGLNYEKVDVVESTNNKIDSEQLIRIMKIAAHINNADQVINI